MNKNCENEMLAEIGGQLTDAEAKTLILKKLYDWVKEKLTRYLTTEKRVLIAIMVQTEYKDISMNIFLMKI